MIQGMVESLAARLAQSPDDAEGWRRLARARAVLGDMDAARAAAENAVSRAPDNVEILLELADLHAPASPADTLSPMFLETLRRVVDLRPNHAQGLFFLGMDASRRGDRLSARRYWEKLLAVLPADAPVATDIRRRLESLGAAP
jgi:cytochrome c-type biogenesis protein CcmH